MIHKQEGTKDNNLCIYSKSVCVCVRVCARACVCSFVIALRKCLFMFDWVGPVKSLGTFKQTISTSCLKLCLGSNKEETEREKEREGMKNMHTVDDLCKI